MSLSFSGVSARNALAAYSERVLHSIAVNIHMIGAKVTNEQILNHLAILSYDRDDRHSPDTYRHGQFVAGWKDATARSRRYTEDTLKSLTWHNLGFRFGQHFGNCPEEKIKQAWNVLASHYERDINLNKTGKTLSYVDPEDKPHGSALNSDRLRAAIRLFRWIYGAEPFQSERYFEWERQYKVDLAAEWQTIVTEDRLNAAIEGNDPLPYANEVSTLFTKTNLLPWRYSVCIKGFKTREKASPFLKALHVLLFDREGAAPPIDAFNDHMRPLYDADLREDVIKPASHSIPSLALWLSDPQHHFFIRSDVVNRAARILSGGVLEGQGQIMTSAYYNSVLDLTQTVRSGIVGLRPRDMIDVQGFLWGAFNRAYIWFGGKTYESRYDMFPRFVEKGVYGVGFAGRPEIAEYFREGISTLKKDGPRRQEFMALLNPKEQKALVQFIELLASPDSVLLAKSSYYDKKVEKSLVRISGVCVTREEYTFDSEVGHVIAADWLAQPDYVVPSGSYYPKIASTLVKLPLEDALTLIGPESIKLSDQETSVDFPPSQTELVFPVQPRYTLEEFSAESRFTKDRIQDWERKLRRKMHIVFPGPPRNWEDVCC